MSKGRQILRGFVVVPLLRAKRVFAEADALQIGVVRGVKTERGAGALLHQKHARVSGNLRITVGGVDEVHVVALHRVVGGQRHEQVRLHHGRGLLDVVDAAGGEAVARGEGVLALAYASALGTAGTREDDAVDVAEAGVHEDEAVEPEEHVVPDDGRLERPDEGDQRVLALIGYG